MKGIAVFLLAMMGCGSPVAPLCQAPDVASTSQYIVNGTPSVDRRSTAYVQGAGSCSGTVVGPHTVLSAAHCQGMTDVLVEGVAWYDVVEELVHEDYIFPYRDLAMFYVEEVLPEPYAAVGLPGECSALVVQGYGVGSGGKLHERVVNETDRAGGFILTDEGICNGDSGGPVYAITESGPVLVGVTSWGTSEPNVCIGGTNGFTDLTLPVNAEWVQEHTR